MLTCGQSQLTLRKYCCRSFVESFKIPRKILTDLNDIPGESKTESLVDYKGVNLDIQI